MDNFEAPPPKLNYRPPCKSDVPDSAETEDEENETIASGIKNSAIRLQDSTAPQTGSSTENWILRGIWILAYVGLFIVFLVQIIFLGRKFISYPTDVSIEIVAKPNLQFPAVTICNNNPVRTNFLKRIREYEDLVYLNQYVLRSVYQFAENEGGITVTADNDCTVGPESGNFKCAKTGICIPWAWRCDGIDNCGDESDETDSDGITCADLQQERKEKEAAIPAAQGICIADYIQCPEENICAKPCDGKKECVKKAGYDEAADAGCTITACGEALTATNYPQSLKNDGYVNNKGYTNELDCSWTISDPAGGKIELTFNDIEIESESNSCIDYLQVFDGSSSKSSVIRIGGKNRICGYSVPQPATVTSSGSSITVTFRSDETNTDRGFDFSYIISGSKRQRRNIPESFILADDLPSSDESLSRNTRGTELNENDGNSRERRDATDSPETGDHSDASGDYTEYDYTEYRQISASDYEANYDKHDEVEQFYGLTDYFSLWKASDLPDYSDFRRVIIFPKGLMQDIGHQRSDFIVQCTYDGRKCSSSFFRTYQDPFYGNCFSFNSIRGRNLSEDIFIRKSSKTGQEYGLKLTLFIDTAQYLGIFGQDQGATLVIHDPLLAARVRTEGMAIAVGEDTFLAIQQSEVKRLGGKYGNCTDSWPESLSLSDHFKKLWPRYSNEQCLEMCIHIKLAEKCGCTDSFETAFSSKSSINNAAMKYCELTDKSQSTCLQGIYSSYRDGELSCDCPQACYTVSYDQTRSSSPWPTDNYAPYLANKLTKTKSAIVRSYLTSMLNQTALDTDYMGAEMRKDFARVEIYYQALNFQKLSESPAYDITAFLSDFGGNIGLWLGWSVLAIFEVVQFCYECVEILIRKKILTS